MRSTAGWRQHQVEREELHRLLRTATHHRADCGRLRARRRRRARLASSTSPEAHNGLPVALPGSTQPQPLSDGEEESPTAPTVAPPAA